MLWSAEVKTNVVTVVHISSGGWYHTRRCNIPPCCCNVPNIITAGETKINA